eukprot:360070-Chlamydomonas_euryale.AAC.1
MGCPWCVVSRPCTPRLPHPGSHTQAPTPRLPHRHPRHRCRASVTTNPTPDDAPLSAMAGSPEVCAGCAGADLAGLAERRLATSLDSASAPFDLAKLKDNKGEGATMRTCTWVHSFKWQSLRWGGY